MYKITNELKSIGFNIGLSSDIIKRNGNRREFNTNKYFAIFLADTDIILEVQKTSHKIEAGSAIFIGPQKEICFGEDLTENIYCITFSEDFYNKSANDSLFLNSQIFFNFYTEAFIAPYFGSNSFNEVILVEWLLKFKEKDESLYISAAHNAIEGLILDAYLNLNQQETEKDQRIDYVSTVNRFKILLQRDYKTEKKVSYYANQLRVSSRKLTDMTEFVYRKSAKQIIIDKIKFESEKAIKTTSFTISEIAYDLCFNDEGNFTNFMKKHIGINPSEMRLHKDFDKL